VHNNKRKSPIKIIKKESMTKSDNELVNIEIDIMNLCRHPNIVTLLHHFEHSEYIIIVIESLTGGYKEEHLYKQKLKFKEPKAASIIYQLASGIKYFHYY